MRADSISFLPAASICLIVKCLRFFFISDMSVGIERGFMTVFSRVKYHFSYYKDDGENKLITTHLDNLPGEIESRPKITTPSPSPQPPPPKELQEVELGRARISALEAELRILKAFAIN
mgnify:CR=1 FL=1